MSFPTESYAETQNMLNLECSPQHLAATNNVDHPVKSNMMIISAGVASKDNDQVSISMRVHYHRILKILASTGHDV
jgi:hypothetical protein